MVGKDRKSFSSVLKAFSNLPETYIFNLLLDKERDTLYIINYSVYKTKQFQDLKKVDFLKKDQRLSTEDTDVQESREIASLLNKDFLLSTRNKGIQEGSGAKMEEDNIIVLTIVK